MRREEDGVGNANARRDAADVGRKGGGGRDRDGSNGRLRTRRTSRSWEGVASPEPIGRACAIAKTESSAKSAAVDVIDRPIAGVGRTARGSFCGLTRRRGGDNFFGVGFERLRVLLSFTDARSESAIGSAAQRDRTPDRSRPERFKPSTSDADDSRFVPSRLVRAPPPARHSHAGAPLAMKRFFAPVAAPDSGKRPKPGDGEPPACGTRREPVSFVTWNANSPRTPSQGPRQERALRVRRGERPGRHLPPETWLPAAGPHPVRASHPPRGAVAPEPRRARVASRATIVGTLAIDRASHPGTLPIDRASRALIDDSRSSPPPSLAQPRDAPRRHEAVPRGQARDRPGAEAAPAESLRGVLGVRGHHARGRRRVGAEVVPPTPLGDAKPVAPNEQHEDGRVLLLEFETFALLNTYAQNNGWTPESMAKRRRWDAEVKAFLLGRSRVPRPAFAPKPTPRGVGDPADGRSPRDGRSADQADRLDRGPERVPHDQGRHAPGVFREPETRGVEEERPPPPQPRTRETAGSPGSPRTSAAGSTTSSGAPTWSTRTAG